MLASCTCDCTYGTLNTYTINPVKGRVFYAIAHLIGCLLAWRSPGALMSSLVYAYELWVFATCPTLRGSTVSYAGVPHVSIKLS